MLGKLGTMDLLLLVPARAHRTIGNTMIETLQLITLYAFLGGAIKFIDQAYDEKYFSIRSANVVAVLAGVVMGYLMATDSPFSTAFFAAMLISLVLARKIDNFAFAAGTILAVASLAAFYPTSQVSWMIVPVILFLVAGFVDEIADSMVHKHNLEGVVQMFFNYRPFSDFALVVMVAAGIFPWIYLLPYFAFTFSYMFVERYSEREYSLQDGMRWIRHRMLRRAH